MRVLFLHAALSGLTAEYKVHLTLAVNAKGAAFDPYFLWQSPVRLDGLNLDGLDLGRVTAHDFGRDMTITPKLSQPRCAQRMAQKLPQTFAFLRAAIKRINPDVIYTSQQGIDVALAHWFSRRLQIPHVIHLHYSVGPWLGKHTLKVIQKSSRLIAVSEYVRQTALLQGVDDSAIDTVINSVPLSSAPLSLDAPDPKLSSVRAEFQMDDSAPLVVAVGRLDPGKGHLALFEAFAQVLTQMPHARLLVCGASTARDSYESQLRQRVHDLQIGGSVIFAGQRSDIPAILRSAQVFCLPTELDPCPLVFLEAMSAGLPVVAYYSGGVPEMVLHEQTGLLSYPGNKGDLARNLQKILSDADYARKLGTAGRERVSTELAPARVADYWLNVLRAKAGVS